MDWMVTMRLNNLTIGEEVELEIVKAEQKSVVFGKVLNDSIDNVIILEPIIIDDCVLVLDDKEIRINVIINIENEKPQVFTGVAFGMTVVGGKACVVIKSTKDSITYNRRSSFRLPLDVQGSVYNEKVIIHDISSSGLSFYTKREKKKRIGSDVKIKFVADYEEIEIVGKIVREVDEGDRTLHGCIIQNSPKINNYIASEQRKRIKGKRR